MLQQIANRVQRDCVSGEDKLALARTALQSVSFMLSLYDLILVVLIFAQFDLGFFLFFFSFFQDAKRLESGIQFLNETEIAGYLLECENILRQQVVDIQILLDGKFPFADQLVQR